MTSNDMNRAGWLFLAYLYFIESERTHYPYTITWVIEDCQAANAKIIVVKNKKALE